MLKSVIVSATIAAATLSSPAHAFHGWTMVAYEHITSSSQTVLHAMVERNFYSSEAQCLMGKGAFEQALINEGQDQVNAVCVFVPEQQ